MEQDVTRGQQWLEEVLALMGLPTSVELSYPSPDSETTIADSNPWLVIDGSQLNREQAKALLADTGKTLDAIQYLANTLLNINLPAESQCAYTIEFQGYRKQREKELRVLAEKTAWQVQETGEEVELDSLSSAERRQIHQFLKQYDGIKSLSRGQDPERRLVVQRQD